MEFNEREKWIWLAAIVDCEGCLGLWKKREKHLRRGYRYQPALTITNSSREFLELIKKTVGCGYISRNTKRKDWYQYEMCNNDLRRVLPQIQPFLIVKKKQCELLLEALKLLEEDRKSGGRNPELIDRNYERLDEIHEEIAKLQNYELKHKSNGEEK